MSNDTPRGFGGYDRADEDEQIRNNPPAAVGNGGTGGLVEKLKAKFAARDRDKVTVIKTNTRADFPVWLELDTDLSEDEMTEFSEAAKVGNRAAKRNGEAKTSRGRLAALTINEKNTRLWTSEPRYDEAAARYVGHDTDADGQPLTVHSEEWLEALGCEGDPLRGLEELIGFTRLLPLYGTYLSKTGLTDEAEVVDPTPGSSGD